MCVKVLRSMAFVQMSLRLLMMTPQRRRVHVSHGSEAPVRAGPACVSYAGSASGPARMSTMFARFCAVVVVVVTVLFL